MPDRELLTERSPHHWKEELQARGRASDASLRPTARHLVAERALYFGRRPRALRGYIVCRKAGGLPRRVLEVRALPQGSRRSKGLLADVDMGRRVRPALSCGRFLCRRFCGSKCT